MTVEAHLRVGADPGDQGADPLLRVAQHHRPGGVDHVHAFRARIHHDPGLRSQRGGVEPVGEHEEADGLHPQIPRGREVLGGHVGLGAVGRDPGHRRARLAGLPEVLDGTHAGQQQHGDPRGGRFTGGARTRAMSSVAKP